jgi:hypothetical protein
MWDNSNSQYGLLGVWSGAEVGVEVPSSYWRDVQKHWTTCQLPTGEWTYRKSDPEGYLAMTCAGVASLLVTHDWLDAPSVGGAVGRNPFSTQLAAGLNWLNQGDNIVGVNNRHTHYLGYDLYGVERVGLASGFKYFGRHDWYRELAEKLVSGQWPNGAWGRTADDKDAIIDTAYTILFLSRGRHPILMNKLRFEGSWTNRPRDVSNLTRYAGRQLERGLNWQVVSLEVQPSDWLDCPILFIASHKPPGFSEQDYEKVRQFVEAGGMLFTHADGAAEAFNQWVPQLVKKVSPAYEMADLPDDHDVYSMLYKLKSPHPKLQGVSNGSRLLIVHSPQDLGTAWQQRAEKTRIDAYQLAINLFVYATGKAELRNRLVSPFIPAPKSAPTGIIKVACAKYAGNWDPEPGAWPRFTRYFQWETGMTAQAEPVDLTALKADAQPVAHLTGTAKYNPTDAEVAAVRGYVEGGGVLLIDACGGSAAFADSMQALLARAFPGSALQALAADQPPLAKSGEGTQDLTRPLLRPFVIERMGKTASGLRILKQGKGVVIYSPLDITSGLVAAPTWGIAGYQPEYAAALVKNLLLWSQRAPGG